METANFMNIAEKFVKEITEEKGNFVLDA